MTATLSAPAAITVAPSAVPASTRFRRKALGVSIIAGSVVGAAGFATTVWETSDKKIDYLNSLVLNPTQSQVAALLLHFGYMAFGAALLVLAAMTRGMRSRVLTVVLGIAGAGAMTLPGLLVTDFYDLAIRQTLPDDLAVQTSDKASSYGLGAIMVVPTIFGLLVGLTAAMVVAAKAKMLHWAVAPVFAVAFVAPIVIGAPGWLPNTIGPAIAFAALSTVGVRALRMTDEQYHRGA